MYDHTFSKLANHLIRYQATHKVGCRPGDCIYGHFNLPLGFVWVKYYCECKLQSIGRIMVYTIMMYNDAKLLKLALHYNRD